MTALGRGSASAALCVASPSVCADGQFSHPLVSGEKHNFAVAVRADGTGGNAFDFLNLGVNDPAFIRIHRLKHDAPPIFLNFCSHPARQRAQRFFALLTVVFHIDRNALMVAFAPLRGLRRDWQDIAARPVFLRDGR